MYTQKTAEPIGKTAAWTPLSSKSCRWRWSVGLIQYDPERRRLVGKIVNVSADESVLDADGKIDPDKLQPITFDPIHNTYRRLSETVGNAFHDGLKLK